MLRFNSDGSAPSDNPFYNAGDGIGPADYVFAEGFRNAFGGNYGWDGTAASMTTLASYNWYTVAVPVNVAFMQPGVFGGSGFPAGEQDHLFVSEAGPTAALGVPATGKRIQEFTLLTILG